MEAAPAFICTVSTASVGAGSPPAHGPGLASSSLPSLTAELRVYMTNLCLISRSVKGTQFYCLPVSRLTVPRPQSSTQRYAHTRAHILQRQPGVRCACDSRRPQSVHVTWPQLYFPEQIWRRVWEDWRRTAAGSRCCGSWEAAADGR